MVYTNTFKSKVISARNNKWAQLYTNGQGWVFVFPMQQKSNATASLHALFHQFGIPAHIHADNAPELQKGNFKKLVDIHGSTLSSTEPHSPWQNRAEVEIQEHKKMTQCIMSWQQVPHRLWDYVSKYAADVCSCLALPMNNHRSGVEIITGNTPDISQFLYFDFYQVVHYLDELSPFPQDKEQLGRWLGPAHSTGQALCYWVINTNGNVLAQSTVQPVKDNNVLYNLRLQRAIRDMDAQIAHCLGPGEQMDDDIEMGETCPRYIISMDETAQQMLLGARVQMPAGMNALARQLSPFGTIICTVPATSQAFEGSHCNAIEAETVYKVKFDDGSIDQFSENAIAASLYDEASGSGTKPHFIDTILEHAWVAHGNPQSRGQWFFEVLWDNGLVTWESLQHMKRIDMTAVADYAVDNNLQGKEQFGGWVRTSTRCKQRIISKIMRRQSFNQFKYGVELPRNMEEAIMLNRKNNNTLWQQAVKKEMDNVMVAFQALEGHERIPQGYKPITVRMIFDVKMDLTRKAQLVAGGHLTDPPDTLTYSGVVSKESVRIGMMLAQANGLKMMMTDIGNAYLNAQVTEKYWVQAGAEFGPNLQGKVLLIVRALYSLKSAGAAWNHHLARELHALGCMSIPSNPDVWMRQASDDIHQQYYNYILVYVDDMLIISHDPQGRVIDVLQARGYICKDLGEPERYLGAQVGCFNLKHGNTVVGQCWYILAEKYIKVAIKNIETRSKSKLDYAKIQLPLESNYKPELDNSPELDDQQINYYQSIIGVLQWIVELGQIDIAYKVGTMA
jgi:Reverse transcriptase (RNA-dependent DNA polymerase)